jgi:hypothetical protein
MFKKKKTTKERRAREFTTHTRGELNHVLEVTIYTKNKARITTLRVRPR